MRIVTIIPARGGSKSVPRKNIINLMGQPLICFTIAYSLKCPLINRTIVSTDDEEIANISSQAGAEVPFKRPTEYAEDKSRDYEFMRHALNFFESKGEIYDAYCLLRPTSPLRPEGLIEAAVEILEQNPHCTSVRTTALVSEHPYRVWKQADEGHIETVIDEVYEPYNLPRQELPKWLFQTGDLELIRRETILRGSVSGSHVFPLIISHHEMVDIDSQEDLMKAEQRGNS